MYLYLYTSKFSKLQPSYSHARVSRLFTRSLCEAWIRSHRSLFSLRGVSRGPVRHALSLSSTHGVWTSSRCSVPTLGGVGAGHAHPPLTASSRQRNGGSLHLVARRRRFVAAARAHSHSVTVVGMGVVDGRPPVWATWLSTPGSDLRNALYSPSRRICCCGPGPMFHAGPQSAAAGGDSWPC